jgi:hypothetical protein
MAGRVFQVTDSGQEFEEIEKTRPPSGDESSW